MNKPQLTTILSIRYLEVLESIFKYQTFLIGDPETAYRFLVLRPPPMMRHIQRLDLTLSAPLDEYTPFTEHGGITRCNRRLLMVLRALRELDCIHDLRISFNVRDRQFWIEVPERGIAAELHGLRVLKKYVVELPPELPEAARAMQAAAIEEPTPFALERRPEARYWAFSSRSHVERLGWHVPEKDGVGDCWVSTDAALCLRNPYRTGGVE